MTAPDPRRRLPSASRVPSDVAVPPTVAAPPAVDVPPVGAASAAATRRGPVPRRMRLPAAMRVTDFRWYWSSQLVSGVGTWAQAVAQSWLVLELTHSAVALGTVTMLQFLPLLVFPLIGGVIADRLPRRRLLLATQTAAALQATLLGLLVVSGTVQVWEVAILALMLGLTNAFNNPAAQAFVPELVGPDLVADAVAMNSIQFNLARLLGGAVGGIAVAAWGIPGALFFNAATYVPALVVLAIVRPRHAVLRRRAAGVRMASELAEGVRHAVTAPSIRVVVALFGVVGLLGFNWQVALPLLAVALHGGVTGFGTLMSALGAGSLVAGIVLASDRRPSERRLALGGLGLGGLLVALGLSPTYALSLALMVVAGFAGVVASVTANTLLQVRTPDVLRGRIMSIYVLLMGGSTPIGAFLLGTIAGGWGIRAGLVVFGALAVVAIPAIQLVARGTAAEAGPHGALALAGTAADPTAPSPTLPVTPLPVDPSISARTPAGVVTRGGRSVAADPPGSIVSAGGHGTSPSASHLGD